MIDFQGSPTETAKRIIKENKALPAWVHVCYFTAFCEYATAGQIEEYLRKKDFKEPILEFNKVCRQGLISKINKKILASKQSLKSFANEDIYHINKRGLAYLNFDFPDLAEEIHRTTEPKLKSLKHSLIIAQSLLHYLSEYEIVSLSSESRLRADKVSERWKQFKRQLNFEETNALGDYKVCLFDPKTEEIFVREAEATVRYSAKSMLNKPKKMDWFAIDERESHRVSIIAQVDCQTLAISKSQTKRTTQNPIQNLEILQSILDLYDGVVSKKIIGLHHNSINGAFHSNLNILLYQEKLFKFTGSNIGKNYSTIYCVKERKPEITKKIYQIKWIYELLFLILSNQFTLPETTNLSLKPQDIFSKKVQIILTAEPIPSLNLFKNNECVLRIFADPIVPKDGFAFTGFSQIEIEKILQEKRAEQNLIFFAIGDLSRYQEMKENKKIVDRLIKI